MSSMSKPVRLCGVVCLLPTLASVLLLSGCDLLTITQSGRGIRDGNDAVSRGEFQKAVEYYEKALDGTMLTAEAQYRLGLLYEDKLKNEVAALHHFERYLELAPQGQFAADVKGSVERLRLVITSRMAEGAVVPAREVTRLKNENLQLREELQGLRGQQPVKGRSAAARATPPPGRRGGESPVAVSRGTPPPLPSEAAPQPPPEIRRALPVAVAASAGTPAATPEHPAAAKQAPTAPAEPSSYTVVSGDTLSKISRKHYGRSSDWQKIADANKETLPDPTKLKPGMVLTIPPK